MFGIIVTVVIIAAIFITILALISRYKRCPSDKLLVIYGAGAKKDESAFLRPTLIGIGFKSKYSYACKTGIINAAPP